MLTAYAIGNIVAHAIKELDAYKKASGVFAALYAKRLYTNAQCWKLCYEQKGFRFSFVEKLDEWVCDSMDVYLTQNPLAFLTEVACYADTLIKIPSKSSRASDLSIDRSPRSAVKPNKLFAHAVMLSDDDGQKNTPKVLPTP